MPDPVGAWLVGLAVGNVGALLGTRVGFVGESVGWLVAGERDGILVGEALGCLVTGEPLGWLVLGDMVGSDVGELVHPSILPESSAYVSVTLHA